MLEKGAIYIKKAMLYNLSFQRLRRFVCEVLVIFCHKSTLDGEIFYQKYLVFEGLYTFIYKFKSSTASAAI